MPFPWKKTRVPRISQIVADLQSPKRGASLVVETGFPTSLIDLFVKNRSRFRKRHRSKKDPPPDNYDPPLPPPPPPPSPVAPSPPTDPEPPRVPTVFPNPQIQQTVAAVSVPDRIIADHSRGANVVVLVVKILVVLVLVAGVKRLTIGITVSAFALLLLEHAVVRCVVSFSSPESLFKKVLKKERVLGTETAELSQLSFEGLLIDDIEVVELEAETNVGICYERRSLSGGGGGGGDVALESCPCDHVSECKIRTSRSGRFRSKMVKKLVPMKLRGSKKEKKETMNNHNMGESVSGVSSSVEEDKLAIEGDESSDTKPDEADCGIGITGSYNEIKVERVGNLGSSMVLVMITLAGLLLGRFSALGLLMTWCCLMKIVRILRRSSHNVPMNMIKCSVLNY